MADALSNDVAISLLGNTIATGAILFVLITIFGPVSGAHFNPAVSFVFYLRGDLAGGMTLLYMIVQVCGGILGTWAAHAMFEVPILKYRLSTAVDLGIVSVKLLRPLGWCL